MDIFGISNSLQNSTSIQLLTSSSSSLSSTIIPPQVFVIITGFIGSLTVSKSYYEALVSASETAPKLLIFGYISAAWLLSIALAFLGYSLGNVPVPPTLLHLTNFKIQLIRWALVLGSIFMTLGPFLLLPPIRKILVMKQKNRVLYYMVKMAQSKYARYISLFLFVIITLFQVFVAYSLTVILAYAPWFQVDPFQAISIGLCYMFISLFYLYAFWYSMVQKEKKEDALKNDGKDSLLRRLRGSMVYKTKSSKCEHSSMKECEDCSVVNIMELQEYLYAYMFMFTAINGATLAEQVYFWYVDMSNLSKMSRWSMIMTFLFGAVAIVTHLCGIVFIFNEAFRIVKQEVDSPANEAKSTLEHAKKRTERDESINPVIMDSGLAENEQKSEYNRANDSEKISSDLKVPEISKMSKSSLLTEDEDFTSYEISESFIRKKSPNSNKESFAKVVREEAAVSASEVSRISPAVKLSVAQKSSSSLVPTAPPGASLSPPPPPSSAPSMSSSVAPMSPPPPAAPSMSSSVAPMSPPPPAAPSMPSSAEPSLPKPTAWGASPSAPSQLEKKSTPLAKKKASSPIAKMASRSKPSTKVEPEIMDDSNEISPMPPPPPLEVPSEIPSMASKEEEKDDVIVENTIVKMKAFVQEPLEYKDIIAIISWLEKTPRISINPAFLSYVPSEISMFYLDFQQKLQRYGHAFFAHLLCYLLCKLNRALTAEEELLLVSIPDAFVEEISDAYAKDDYQNDFRRLFVCCFPGQKCHWNKDFGSIDDAISVLHAINVMRLDGREKFDLDN